MSYKDIQSRYILMARVFVLLAVIGIGILVYAGVGDDPSHVAFSLIAFIISVAALIVTLLQSLSITRQVQMTAKSVHEVKEASEQIRLLVGRDARLAHDIREDIELDHEIISILEEHGVGNDDGVRRDVASRIAKRIKKH